MTRHIRKAIIGVGAISALALGGAGFAQAQSAPEPVGGPDTDAIQSGDQKTPDTTAASTGKVRLAAVTTPGTGTSTAPEAPGAAEAPGSETATASDGPGGHADEPGNPNADHQATGVE
ncbi:MAG: hypothetical protein QOJ97_1110 [Solirubrobacteraceae bacterium]|jgi:hypothetical protein|nr:hypothetical protein [Solirubrobacteraceae bacterium]